MIVGHDCRHLFIRLTANHTRSHTIITRISPVNTIDLLNNIQANKEARGSVKYQVYDMADQSPPSPPGVPRPHHLILAKYVISLLGIARQRGYVCTYTCPSIRSTVSLLASTSSPGCSRARDKFIAP